MEENPFICKNCKQSYIVVADGKKYLICDRLDKEVHNKNFCDDFEAE